jgi:hypothetical protein
MWRSGRTPGGHPITCREPPDAKLDEKTMPNCAVAAGSAPGAKLAENWPTIVQGHNNNNNNCDFSR